MEKLIVSDIDGTLLDDGDASMGLVTLRKLVRVNRERVGLVYATGRTFSSTRRLIQERRFGATSSSSPKSFKALTR